MSLLQKSFGWGEKDQVPTPQEAIQRLREVEDMLMKKSDFLEKKINQEILTVKKHGTTFKRIASEASKRRKRYDQQLQKINGTLSTIEYQRESLADASTNTEVLQVMGVAAKALKITDDLMVELEELEQEEIEKQQF